LIDHGKDLSEEAVGFGLPVVKRGLHAVFPGTVALTLERDGSLWRAEARFTFNLIERISRGSSPALSSRLIYVVKDLLAAAIRRSRVLRGPLTAASSRLRSLLDLKTVYEEAGFHSALVVHFAVDSATGVIRVSGGTAFDTYRDSAGAALRGARIGAWDRVTAPEASMVSSTRKIAFTVAGGDGARLYRGREVVGSRLAWAGFGYSFDPALGKLDYLIRLERVP
jgi:hypothetical protein